MVEQEKAQALRRVQLYRKGSPAKDFRNQTVILIDDGIATGFTIKAAIKMVRKAEAKKIIVAVPVSPPDTLLEIKSLVDEIYCHVSPDSFSAVGEVYLEFYPTEDEEVISLIQEQNFS